MQYELDENGNRIGIYNGLNGNEYSENLDGGELTLSGPTGEESPTSNMTNKTISPIFGEKQYVGNLA